MNVNAGYYGLERHEVTEFLPEQQDIACALEIGCGSGQFRSNLPPQCEYWGVELNDDAAKAAAKCFDNVLHGSINVVLADLPDEYFDLVICNDVIEHMNDPDWFLRSIKAKMKSGGRAYLVGSIPNVRYYRNLFNLIFKKDWEYEDAGILDRTHLRFFTQRSFIRTLGENGYVIDALHGINRVNARSGRVLDIAKVGIVQVLCMFLGHDIAYPQFGFRVHPEPSVSHRR